MEGKKRPTVSMMSQQLKASRSTFISKSMSRMKVRKASYGFTDVSGIGALRSSVTKEENKRPVLMYLNTYQLDPHVKFDPVRVKNIIEKLLDELFNDHVYNKQASPDLSLRIASELLFKVKALEFNRYRLISIVTIAQQKAQSYSNAVAFVLDEERDSYANVTREVYTAFIQVTIFGVYLD